MADNLLLEVLEDDTLGRVTTQVRVENLRDLWDAERDMLASDKVRRLEIMQALVDTGSSTLALPTRMIQQLGLNKVRERSAITSTGVAKISMYDAVRVTIHGRDCIVEVMEVPNDVPPLVGQVPLEM